MSLILSLPRLFSLSLSLSALYLEAGRFCFRAAFETCKGSPLWEISRHEVGTGWTLIAGPLLVEAAI
jgi:hypothetical protein